MLDLDEPRRPGGGDVDRSRIDRVVTNLLSNAIKFGPGQPIEVLVSAERGVARLAVRDHGIGIDPAQRAWIFGRFERAVSERHYGGLGLGLYISRRIVEDHGGSIRCESLPGAGATFTVELPAPGRGSQAQAPPERAPGSPRGRSHLEITSQVSSSIPTAGSVATNAPSA